jgi:hypothetical protein
MMAVIYGETGVPSTSLRAGLARQFKFSAGGC